MTVAPVRDPGDKIVSLFEPHADGDARYARFLRSLARVKLLILDDWGPETLTPDQARDLLEIAEDRYD